MSTRKVAAARKLVSAVKVKKPVKVEKVGKYDRNLVVTCLVKEQELHPAKKNGRNPYPYYLALSGRTIGEILDAGKGQWNGKDAVVPLDFWWDSHAQEERKAHPAPIIRIGS